MKQAVVRVAVRIRPGGRRTGRGPWPGCAVPRPCACSAPLPWLGWSADRLVRPPRRSPNHPEPFRTKHGGRAGLRIAGRNSRSAPCCARCTPHSSPPPLRPAPSPPCPTTRQAGGGAGAWAGPTRSRPRSQHSTSSRCTCSETSVVGRVACGHRPVNPAPRTFSADKLCCLTRGHGAVSHLRLAARRVAAAPGAPGALTPPTAPLPRATRTGACWRERALFMSGWPHGTARPAWSAAPTVIRWRCFGERLPLQTTAMPCPVLFLRFGINRAWGLLSDTPFDARFGKLWQRLVLELFLWGINQNSKQKCRRASVEKVCHPDV